MYWLLCKIAFRITIIIELFLLVVVIALGMKNRLSSKYNESFPTFVPFYNKSIFCAESAMEILRFYTLILTSHAFCQIEA